MQQQYYASVLQTDKLNSHIMLGLSQKTPLICVRCNNTNIKSTVKATLQAAVMLFSMWIISN